MGNFESELEVRTQMNVEHAGSIAAARRGFTPPSLLIAATQSSPSRFATGPALELTPATSQEDGWLRYASLD